jgi:hypothetical protein
MLAVLSWLGFKLFIYRSELNEGSPKVG